MPRGLHATRPRGGLRREILARSHRSGERLASGMAPSSNPEPTDERLAGAHGHLARALAVFWVVCFLAIGWVTVRRVLDTSTSVDVPSAPQRAEDGTWSLESVEAVCREALEAHGVDPASSTPVDYIPGERLGSNASNLNRILTAWEVGEERRRVTVYLDVDGARTRCVVSESK